jgi:hypothetical protein
MARQISLRRRALFVLVLTVASIASLVPASSAGALTVAQAIDRYAPLVYLHPNDQWLPTSTAAFIQHSGLWWSHSGGCRDHLIAAKGDVQPGQLNNPFGGYGHRLAGDPNGCDGHHGELYFAGERTRPRDEGNWIHCAHEVPHTYCPEGFYLDVDDNERPHGGNGAPVYYEFRPSPRSITYWFFYAYNEGPVNGGIDNHEGDWERISVKLNQNNQATEVAYFQHNGACVLPWSGQGRTAPRTEAGHPIVHSADGSHASYPQAGTYAVPTPVGDAQDHAAKGGPLWGTWNNLRDVTSEAWYGFGGAWGEVGNFDFTTGPLGPSLAYKFGPPNFSSLGQCARPDEAKPFNRPGSGGPWSEALARNRLADVNGDGRADRVAWNNDSAWVELSTGSSFAPGQQWTYGTPFYGTRGNLLGDVNGDRRADRVAWNDAGAWVELSTGSSFAPEQQWTYGTPFYGTLTNALGDVNGDGRADRVAWNTDSIWVELSTGSSFAPGHEWACCTPLYGTRANRTGDVNSDGRTDLIAWNDASVWVALSTGSGFTAPQQWAVGTPFYGTRTNLAGDVNADRRTDLVAWNDAGAWVELSTGSSFAPGQQWTVGTPFYGT